MLLLVAGLTAVSAVAQTPAASLIGRIRDETNAPVAAARVEITSLDTNEAQSYTTGADGGFSALELPVGSYRVVIAKDGFRTLEQPKVELQLDETARLDFVMRAGDPAQRLVLGAAEIVMDTGTADVGETADEEEIEDTPLGVYPAPRAFIPGSRSRRRLRTCNWIRAKPIVRIVWRSERCPTRHRTAGLMSPLFR